MEVWAARVALKARPDRQRLLSQENSLQTTLRFSARSQLERLVAGLAAPLAGVAAQLAAPAPRQPSHHEVVSHFLLCRRRSHRLFRRLLRNGRSIMRSRHAFCFVAGYRNARQEIIIQCVGRPRQNARLQHPRTAAGAYPVVQADAHDIISICGGLCRQSHAEETGYPYT
jgi:hypothetical protein